MHYTTYGHGTILTGLNISAERMQHLLSMNPELDKKVHTAFTCKHIFNPTFKDCDSIIGCFELDAAPMLGVYDVLCRVIKKYEDISFSMLSGKDKNVAIVFGPHYPWKENEITKNITPEKIESILKEYIGILIDDEVECCYLENV